MGFFNWSLLDVWNHPVLKITRAGAKLGAKALSSAGAKEEMTTAGTPEFAELLNGAENGDSNAQCLLALHYAENGDYEKATSWR